jgi:predicted Zn-dependent protease with MMP-like domain
MEREKFEELVIKAVKGLPPEFQEKLENVDVVVEDLPNSRQLSKLRLRQGFQLLGLYEGVPQIRRGQSYNLVLPDKITIFQKSIEATGGSEREIEAEIGEVIRHEIAHHFGIDDETLRRIESRKPRGKQK